MSRKILKLPTSFPKAGLHVLPDDLGLDVPSVCEDYRGAAICAWTRILHDEDALGTTVRAFLQRVTTKFHQWPIELAFNFQREKYPSAYL